MASNARRDKFYRTATAIAALFIASCVAGIPAMAQFKTVGPAPYTPVVARQRIKALLAKMDPANRRQSIDTISGLLVWYRDIVDDELITAWKKDDGRDNLPDAVTALADARVASAIVEFSWHERPQAFQLAYAPMFGNLMLRFPDSAKPFLDDLLASTNETPGASNPPPALNLAESQQFAVCRILLDMPPRVGSWEKAALQILPRYREAAETLLAADEREGDSEKRVRAEQWMLALRPTPPPSSGRTILRSSPPPAASNSAANANSGTLQCSGAPIAPNGEYTFYNVPTDNRRFEYDRKIWDVRLEPGQGDTRDFVLINKSSKAQKGCVVRWTSFP